MTNPTTITDAMVEAAARAIAQEDWRHSPSGPHEWDLICGLVQKNYRELARAALDAAERAAWMPIDTAPHNTPLILGWEHPTKGGWRTSLEKASWDWKLGDGYRSGTSRHHAATHWRPHPTPPGGE